MGGGRGEGQMGGIKRKGGGRGLGAAESRRLIAKSFLLSF